MRGVFEGMGVTWPAYADWVSAAAAFVAIGICWAIAWFVAKRAGPRLARLAEHRGGVRGGELAGHVGALTRSLLVTILLAIVINVDPWRPLALILLGIAVAAAAASFVWGVVRGVNLPQWMAALLGSVTFVALLARSVGTLKPITDILNRVGFNVGDTRISLLTILQVVITALALYAIVKVLNRVVGHSIRRANGLDATQQLLAQKLSGVAIVTAAFFIGIDVLGIDLTALAVFSGAFGLAIGFGLQKTFGNLIAGIILLMDRSVKPGDVIVVGDSFGHVTKIGVRAVSIVTRDGKEHLIPNENLMTQEVENWSYSSRDVRVHIPVGVGYGCDITLAQRLMIQAAKESKRVLDSPEPRVWLRAFGESSVDHEILVWIGDPEAGVGNVQSEILNRIWVLFKENKIELPFPQRDIRIKEMPAVPAAPGA